MQTCQHEAMGEGKNPQKDAKGVIYYCPGMLFRYPQIFSSWLDILFTFQLIAPGISGQAGADVLIVMESCLVFGKSLFPLLYKHEVEKY